MANWAGGNFVHTNNLTSCVDCHKASQWPSTNGPFVDVGGSSIAAFSHLTQATGDCAGCHTKALANVSAANAIFSWAQTGQSYPRTAAAITTPDPGTTDFTALTAIPTWGGSTGTSIIAAATKSVSIPMTMNHLSLQISAATLQNCVLCHKNGLIGDYRPGYFHSSLPVLTPPPTSCAECHGAGTLFLTGAPTNGMPQGLTGTVGLGRNPATPEMNHFATSWSQNAGKWVHGTTPAFNQDCVLCHNDPDGSWSGANFHTSLAAAGKAQPTTCLDCHANNRPSGAVPAVPSLITPTAFDHANGMGECASCHVPPTTTNLTTPPSVALWASGSFHPKAGPPTSCSSCHEPQRPTSTNGWVAGNVNAPFDFSNHGNGTDCASCHGQTNSFVTMSGWQGGFFKHVASTTSCSSCHASQRPTQIVNTFDHSTSGMGDCAGCHNRALSGVIAQAGAPNVTAWVDSGDKMPQGPVGSQTLTIPQTTLVSSVTPLTSYSQVTSTSTVNATVVLQMLHTSKQIPSIHWQNGVVGGTLNCVDCHTGAAPGALNPTFAGGRFHTDARRPYALAGAAHVVRRLPHGNFALEHRRPDPAFAGSRRLVRRGQEYPRHL